MSDLQNWMADAESIENIDKCVKIVSTSPSAASTPNAPPVQSPSMDPAAAAPVSKSCDDLLSSSRGQLPLSRSQSCLSLASSTKYQHVQSKVKQYIDNISQANFSHVKTAPPPPEASKEEYLQEINSRLVRELEEKNFTLQQLQENYEHLLLKYAEAQNKIDNLRFQSSANGADASDSGRKRKKSFVQKLPRPLVYTYKNPLLGDCQGNFSKEFCDREGKIDRPSTLAVDPNVRIYEKDLKAVTPTDSEGMSSVVTSMSGHSKILTNLDDKEEEKKQPLKTEVLEKTLPVFDKVTHWQNSLPPLEMIEKPDTSYFDVVDTPSTRYNELPLSDLENIPETPEWTPQQARAMSQIGMKKYLRTLSLPSSLTRRNILAQIYKKKNNHTIDVSSPLPQEDKHKEIVISDASQPDTSLIMRRKKRPPFLRSASLPVYDCETPRPIARCPVPPLDLENLTLTEDDESSLSQQHAVTSPTFLTSHDCSFQTLDSLNSCKATMSDVSSSSTPRPHCVALHKSTSITPDRSRMFFHEGSREFGLSCCNICGEAVQSGKAASYHGLHVSGEAKEPMYRSYSFNSNMTSPSQRVLAGADKDAIEAFDLFTSNLKARSTVTMKALSAHVNKS